MGLIANLLKRKSVPQEKVDSSLQMLDMLKEKCGADTGRYLSLMVDPRNAVPSSEPSTLQDLDELEQLPSGTYSPPVEAVVNKDFIATAEPDGAYAVEHPIEAGINLFFDEFARQASQYNQTASNPEHSISIQRPSYSAELFPEPGGTAVLNACLHTNDWGLFFFGHGGSIDIYLLPFEAKHSLAFKDVKADACQPHLAVTTRPGGARTEWYVDEKRFSREHIPDLSRRLLDDLVHATTKSTASFS